MTIDRISRQTILVTLGQEDIERYRLDFDGDDASARRGLTLLMNRVGEVCGLDHSGRSYLIEALPAGDSCLLIISVRRTRRRSYRIKRITRQECFVFDSVDALLDWRSTGTVGGDLYLYQGGWWLLPAYPPAPRSRRRLAEYAEVRELTAVAIARIRELGTPLTALTTRHAPRPRCAH